MAPLYTAGKQTPFSFIDVEVSLLEQHPPMQEASFLLDKTPSVSIYSDSGSYQGYSYFRMRGIDQTRINMTLDGIPLNEPEDQGVYFSNYPGVFASLSSAQVQRGVGMSQNGTASFAGSVQLTSADLTQPEKRRLSLELGSFSSIGGNIEYSSGERGKQSFYLLASGVSSDGYKYDSANQSYSLLGSAKKDDAQGQWRLLAFTGRQENKLAWLGVGQSDLDQDRKTNANRDENDTFAQSLVGLGREQPLGDNTELVVQAYYTRLKGNYDFVLNNFLQIDEPGEVYNYALASEFIGAFASISHQAQSIGLSAGLHVNSYERVHEGKEKTGDSFLYENTGYKDSQSAFVKLAYGRDKLYLYADLQGRQTQFDYHGSVALDSYKWSFINPRLGITYALDGDWGVYYSVGKTGREPTRTDIFGGNDNLELDESGEPLIFVTEAEWVVDHEAGVRFVNELTEWSVNLFHMSFSNEITLNGGFGPNGLLLNEDVDKSIRQGLESAATVRLAHSLKGRFSLAYTDSEIKDMGNSFLPVLTPKWLFNGSMFYSVGRYVLSFELQHQSQSYINLANTERIDAFSTCNIFLGYTFGKVETRLHVNNVFDKKYLRSGSMDIYGEPGYFVGAPMNFLLVSSFAW